MGSSAALLGQLVLSLGVVVALLALLAKVASRGGLAARAAVGNRPRIELLARQPLGRSASLAVVKVADKALVVGVTDAGIRLLGESDPRAWEPAPPPEIRTPLTVDPVAEAAPESPARPGHGGHGLRALLENVRERTVRR